MPEYNRLYNSLRNQILAGHYAVGQMLSPERQLCEEFNVSRITARHAIRLLQEQGLVERFQGRGTFVRSIKAKKLPIQSCDFTGSVRKAAPTMKRKLLTREIIVAPEEIQKVLSLKEDGRCLLIERLDVLEDEPIAYDRGYIPLEYTDSIGDDILTRVDFFDLWIERQKIELSYGIENIEAVCADKEASERLKISVQSPILLVTDTSFDGKGNALVVFESLYRGDRIKLISTNKGKVQCQS